MAKGDYKSGQPRKPRVNHEKERADRFLALLRRAQKELETLKDDAGCDHSVGICWCSYFHTLEDINRAIECEDRSEAFIKELDP